MTEQQIAKPSFDAIATTRDGQDITRPYVDQMLRLLPQDSVLEVRGGGDLEIYRAVLTDDHVGACFAQRRLAVTSLEWNVESGGKRVIDKKAADFLKAQLNAIRFDDVTDKMLYGIFYGYSAAECLWARDGAQVVLDQIRVRDPRRFVFHPDFSLRMLTVQSMLEGIELPDRKFWTFTAGGQHSDDPYGLGLAHWLYWPVLFKRRGIQFWLVFLEKYGQPTAVGEFPAGASASQKQTLLDAVQAIRTDTGLIIPQGMLINLLEAKRSGTADYDTLCQRMEDSISRIILGQELSSKSHSTGMNSGIALIQNEVRMEAVKADSDLVCNSFNATVAKWLTEWNFPGAAVPRVWRNASEPEDLDMLVKRDVALASIGFVPTPERIAEIYGDGYVQSAPIVPQGAGGNAAFAEGAPVLPDPPALQSTRASAEISPAMAAWINQIKALVDSATSLQDIRDGLMKLAPDMSLDQYTAAMQRALAAAALAGRYEILQEAGA